MSLPNRQDVAPYTRGAVVFACAMGGRIRRTVARVAIVAAATVSGLGCFLLPDEEELLIPELLQEPQITYRTVTAKIDTTERKTIVIGHFVYRDQRSVFFEHRAGPLRSLYVGLGDTVVATSLLVQLIVVQLHVVRMRVHQALNLGEG